MFRKLINDDRSIEWNILMFAIILLVVYLIIFTPIVLIGLSIHPELSSTLTEAPEGMAKVADKFKQIASILEFFILGTVLEFFRRKKSENFKITDKKANKFLIYFCVQMLIYNICLTLGGVVA